MRAEEKVEGMLVGVRVMLVLFVLLVGCGSGGPRLRSTTTSASARVDPAALLLEVGATRVPLLRSDARTVEELEAARDTVRGDERRRALLDLARSHMLAAGESDDRATRRHRSSAERAAEAAARGTRDATILAESAFVPLWLAYRSDDRGAAARAARFTTRHAQSGELALLGWVIRAELAFAAEQWRDAITSYRYALGELGHPLYAYALYRSAQSHEHAGETAEARQALQEVAHLGCDASAEEPTRRVALLAARELGDGTRTDVQGREIPASCTATAPSGGATSEEWRPAE